MRYSKNKDFARRNYFFKIEDKNTVQKLLKRNVFLPKVWRVNASYNLRKYSSHCSQIHNFCIYSYRSRGILRDFKISRHFFKELASSGKLYGVCKSSW